MVSTNKIDVDNGPDVAVNIFENIYFRHEVSVWDPCVEQCSDSPGDHGPGQGVKQYICWRGG